MNYPRITRIFKNYTDVVLFIKNKSVESNSSSVKSVEDFTWRRNRPGLALPHTDPCRYHTYSSIGNDNMVPLPRGVLKASRPGLVICQEESTDCTDRKMDYTDFFEIIESRVNRFEK